MNAAEQRLALAWALNLLKLAALPKHLTDSHRLFTVDLVEQQIAMRPRQPGEPLDPETVYDPPVIPFPEPPEAHKPDGKIPRFNAEASNNTVIVNNEEPIAYGTPFVLSGDWLNNDGSHAGTPPVHGMQVLNDKGDVMGKAFFEKDLSVKPNNVYTVTLDEYGDATNLWLKYGEVKAKFDEPIVTVFDTGVKIAARVPVVAPPVGPGKSNIQGFGMDASFAHNPEGKPIPIAWIENLKNSGESSPREGFERQDRRFIVPLRSGHVDPGEVIKMQGQFAYLGETAHLAFRSPKDYNYTIFGTYSDEQFIRNLTAFNGQWSGPGEPNRRIFSVYKKDIVIASCSLLFNVDGCINAWHNGKKVGAERCTFTQNLMGVGLLGSHEDPKAANAGKALLIGHYTKDITASKNAFYSGPFRTPESHCAFIDAWYNVACSYLNGFMFLSQVTGEYDCAANAVGNVIITTEEIRKARDEYLILVGTRQTHKKMEAYVEDNYINTGSGLEDLEGFFRKPAERLHQLITKSPATGNPVPSIDQIEKELIVETVLGNAGAFAWDRTDADVDIIDRIRRGEMEYFDGVAGMPEEYPYKRAKDGYERRLYRVPGRDSGIPIIPNATSPHFDPSAAVDGVPDWFKRELGFTSFLADLDLTTKFSFDDGATDFEHYVWRATGVEPMSRKAA